MKIFKIFMLCFFALLITDTVLKAQQVENRPPQKEQQFDFEEVFYTQDVDTLNFDLDAEVVEFFETTDSVTRVKMSVNLDVDQNTANTIKSHMVSLGRYDITAEGSSNRNLTITNFDKGKTQLISGGRIVKERKKCQVFVPKNMPYRNVSPTQKE